MDCRSGLYVLLIIKMSEIPALKNKIFIQIKNELKTLERVELRSSEFVSFVKKIIEDRSKLVIIDTNIFFTTYNLRLNPFNIPLKHFYLFVPCFVIDELLNLISQAKLSWMQLKSLKLFFQLYSSLLSSNKITKMRVLELNRTDVDNNYADPMILKLFEDLINLFSRLVNPMQIMNFLYFYSLDSKLRNEVKRKYGVSLIYVRKSKLIVAKA